MQLLAWIKKRKDLLQYFVIFCITIFVLFVLAIKSEQIFPNNTTFAISQQIVENNVTLYKDKIIILPPGAFYFNLPFLKLLSPHKAILAEYLFLSSVVLILILRLTRDLITVSTTRHSSWISNIFPGWKFISNNNALFCLPFVVVIILNTFIGWADISAMLGVTIILFASRLMFNYYDKMSEKSSTIGGIIPIGICIGLLGVTRQDMVSYMWGLYFWAMFWAGMADVEGKQLSLRRRAVRGLWQGIFLTLVAVLTVGIVMCYFVFNAGSQAIFEQLVIGAFEQYNNFQLLSLSSFKSIIFYLPVIVALLSLIVLIIKNRRKIIRANTPMFWKQMLVINLTLNIFNYSLIGEGLSQALPALLFASLALFNLLRFNFQFSHNSSNNRE